MKEIICYLIDLSVRLNR